MAAYSTPVNYQLGGVIISSLKWAQKMRPWLIIGMGAGRVTVAALSTKPGDDSYFVGERAGRVNYVIPVVVTQRVGDGYGYPPAGEPVFAPDDPELDVIRLWLFAKTLGKDYNHDTNGNDHRVQPAALDEAWRARARRVLAGLNDRARS